MEGIVHAIIEIENTEVYLSVRANNRNAFKILNELAKWSATRVS